MGSGARSIAKAIPTYIIWVFSSYLFTIGRIKISTFWRWEKGDENKIHWLTWSKMCQPKSEGGVGFHDFYSFNIKCWWNKSINYSNSYCRQNYYKINTFNIGIFIIHNWVSLKLLLVKYSSQLGAVEEWIAVKGRWWSKYWSLVR